ncbi:MAG: hypothetical protein ACYS21_14570 [Planctomycetota bacterium]|jgi:hypothetical protein
MGTATQVTDFSDLYTDLQNRARETTGVTARENQAKRYINISLHDMHVGFGERFPWAERQAILVTQARYNTGTVTVVAGSTALVGTSTAWATANDFGVNNMRVGGKITIDGGREVYEISAVTDNTNATLSSKYVASSTSGLSYVYFEDEYALASDYLRPIDQQRFSETETPIELIGRTEFRRRYPRNGTVGSPVVATIMDKPMVGNATPVRKVRLHPPPDATAYMIPYSYVTSNLAVSSSGTAKTQLVLDDDEPIVPLRYRHMIVWHALEKWYRDQKDDPRAEMARRDYIDLINRVAGDNEIGDRRPQIRPRVAGYRRAARRPWGGSGTRQYETSGEFDRMLV